MQRLVPLLLKSGVRREILVLSRNSICASNRLWVRQPMRMCTSSAEDLESEANRAKIAEARKKAQERKAANLKRQQEAWAAEAAEGEKPENNDNSENSTSSSHSEATTETKAEDAAGKTEKVEKKPDGPPFSFSREFTYIKEYAAKYSGPRRERRRIAQDVEETKQRWAAGELLKRKKAATEASAPKKRPEEEDLAHMTKEEREAYEAKLLQEEEEVARINSTPLMHVGDNETVWDQRLTAIKDRLRRTWPATSWRKLRRTASMSDNAVLQQARDIKDDMADNVQDIKEFYGTTQHPVISRLRDGVDNVTGETETGWAIGQIRRVDPAFEIQLFLEDMEEYMIPLVIEAYLKGDMVVLSTVMEEKAHGGAFSSCREREVLGHYWDSRILNVDHLDFQGATVENEIPYVTLSFVCQHVHCVKDKKGVIVEGHAAEVKSVYYAWKLRRDLDNPDFDWKVVDMHCQRIFSLVG